MIIFFTSIDYKRNQTKIKERKRRLNRIKEFRTRKKLSQLELAKKMNVKQNTISEWENDRRLPNIRKAIKLAEILNTTIENLYK